MSPRSDRLRTDDDRRLAADSTATSDSLPATVGRWLWTSGYQGLGQVCLLSAPMLWLVFRSPRADAFLKPIALLLVVVTPLLVGAFREGHLPAGRPWPALTNDRLSFAGGYWSIYRRGVLLNHVLGLAAYGGAAVGLLVGSVPAALGVGVVLALCGVGAIPWLTPETTRATVGRLCYAVASLTLAVAVGAPFSALPRFRTAPAALVLLTVLTVVDLRPWVRSGGASA